MTSNKLEQIAEKQRKAALAKQDEDVVRFAKQVAGEVLGGIGDLSLKDSVADLATNVAQAIVLSNQRIDDKLTDSFSKLLLAVQENKPDNTSQVELSLKIAETLAGLELSPIINVESLSATQLKEELSVLLARLPEDSQRVVTIAYENAMPDKYINVRLTDGISHYTARGGGGVSINTEVLAKESKQDDLITAIGNIGATPSYITEMVTVGALTYIGNAVPGSATSDNVWQIKRLDTTSGFKKRWADGNDNFDNIWDNYASLSYS